MRRKVRKALFALLSHATHLGLFLLGRKRTLVFIFSAQRSGSTLLKALLAQGTGVSHLPEFRLERWARLPFRLYYEACRLSPKPILVLKQPSIFGRENGYPRLHRLWKRKAKIIVLYREPKGYLKSVENAATNVNTLYRHLSAQQRMDHWISTNASLQNQFGDPTQNNVVWVSYEELTKNPKTITRRLFRFIGSEYSDGVDEYRKAHGVEWDWGSDDGGEVIRSLRVVAPTEIRTHLDPSLQPALRKAEQLYQELCAQRHTIAAENLPRYLDTSRLSRPTFLKTSQLGEAVNRHGTKPKILALFPSLPAHSWAHRGGNKQAAKFLGQALLQHYGEQITFCNGVTSNLPSRLADWTERTRYRLNGNPRNIPARDWQLFGRVLSRHLKSHRYDRIFLFGQFGWASFLETEVPIIAMWDSILQHSYDVYQPLRLHSLDQLSIHATECVGLAKCRTVALPSEFSKRGYQRYVSFDDSKVKVVPYGANWPLEFARPDRSSLTRSNQRLELIFVGSAWERKGGQIAVQVLHELRSRGVSVRLTLVGAEIPKEAWSASPDIETVGELRKDRPEELTTFTSLLARSHVLLLPSRAEFVPGIIREANLMGVPCMASPIGALPEMILDGVTGWLVERNALAYARKLETLWKEKSPLQRAAEEAYRTGESFRWNATALSVITMLEDDRSEPLKKMDAPKQHSAS